MLFYIIYMLYMLSVYVYYYYCIRICSTSFTYSGPYSLTEGPPSRGSYQRVPQRVPQRVLPAEGPPKNSPEGPPLRIFLRRRGWVAEMTSTKRFRNTSMDAHGLQVLARQMANIRSARRVLSRGVRQSTTRSCQVVSRLAYLCRSSVSFESVLHHFIPWGARCCSHLLKWGSC